MNIPTNDSEALMVMDGAAVAVQAAQAAATEVAQLELSLRAVPADRPRRVVKTRRYAVARWWFAKMRETVRSTREWDGREARNPGGEQALLTLTQPPTRFERPPQRHAA